jgi:hypothetical protein
VPATRECNGARVGKGYGFICGETRGKTEIYAVRAPLGLSLWRRFDSPRVVSPSDNGALVVSGRCEPSAAGSSDANARCIVSPKGEQFELTLADGGLSRVVALRDGRAAVLVPPTADGPGSLRVVDRAGTSRKLPLVLGRGVEGSSSLLKLGFWMHGFVESTPGVLSGWVVGRGSFVGVRVDLDGKVRASAAQRSVENALFSGQHALVVGVSGIAEQTSNGGFGWADAGLPASVESEAQRTEATAPEVEQGCSLLGCAFRRWLRVGWSSASARPLSPPPRPESTVLPSPGGGRWQLACEPAGEVSPPALPIVARRGYGGSDPAAVPSPWLPLLEVAAPPLGPERVGIDVGTESELVQLRAYVSGAKSDFAKDAAFVVRVVDRYRTQGAVWSTAATPSPWPDLEQALDAFGYEGNGPAGWRLALDPGGEAGVLSVNWRGTTDLYLLERDAVIRRIENAPRHGLGVVTSAVRAEGVYYVVTLVDTRTFRVFELAGEVPRLVGEYRDVPFGGGGTPLLVRSARQNSGQASRPSESQSALGLWARGTGWYVFPVDARTGASAPAIEITPRVLSTLPRVCAEDEEGFLLEGPLGLEPSIEWGEGQTRGFQARAVEGRFVVSAQGLCVRELAAQADRPVRAQPLLTRGARRTQAPARGSVPLVLSDRGERGRRYGFLCGKND